MWSKLDPEMQVDLPRVSLTIFRVLELEKPSGKSNDCLGLCTRKESPPTSQAGLPVLRSHRSSSHTVVVGLEPRGPALGVSTSDLHRAQSSLLPSSRA